MVFTKDSFVKEPIYYEKMAYFQKEHGLIRSSSLTFKINAKNGEKFTKEQFFLALKKLIFKYPLLVCSLYDKSLGTTPSMTQEKSLVRGPKLRLLFNEDIFTTLTDSKFNNQAQIINLLNSLKFDSDPRATSAMWRLIYFPNLDMVSWTFDTSVFDASSVVVYMKDLISFINSASTDFHGADINMAEFESMMSHGKSPVLFDFEDNWNLIDPATIPESFFGTIDHYSVLSKFSSKLNKFKIAGDLEKSSFLNRIITDKNKLYESENIISPRSTEYSNPVWRVLNIKSNDLQTIMDKCRLNNNCDLVVLFTVVYFVTVNQCIPKQFSSKYLKCSSFLDLRSLLKDKFVMHQDYQNQGDSLSSISSKRSNKKIDQNFSTGNKFKDGNYTLPYFPVHYEPVEEFKWEHCVLYSNFVKMLTSTTNKNSAQNKFISNLYTTHRNTNAKTSVLESLDTHNKLFMNVDDLGFCKFDTTANFFIEDVLYTRAPNAVYGDSQISMISSPKGGLNIVVSVYEENLVERFDYLCTCLQANLSSLAA